MFGKGLVNDFGQKVEVFSSVVFIKNRSRKRDADVLDRKEAFQDY